MSLLILALAFSNLRLMQGAILMIALGKFCPMFLAIPTLLLGNL